MRAIVPGMTGSEFRAWRKSVGYTIHAMAGVFRVSDRTIVQWEQGEAMPGLAEVALEAVTKKIGENAKNALTDRATIA